MAGAGVIAPVLATPGAIDLTPEVHLELQLGGSAGRYCWRRDSTPVIGTQDRADADMIAVQSDGTGLKVAGRRRMSSLLRGCPRPRIPDDLARHSRSPISPGCRWPWSCSSGRLSGTVESAEDFG